VEAVDELYAPELAAAAKRWIAPFRAAFPDVHMQVDDLIARDDKVVGRAPGDWRTRSSGCASLSWVSRWSAARCRGRTQG
jgi:hypothetical protein